MVSSLTSFFSPNPLCDSHVAFSLTFTHLHMLLLLLMTHFLFPPIVFSEVISIKKSLLSSLPATHTHICIHSTQYQRTHRRVLQSSALFHYFLSKFNIFERQICIFSCMFLIFNTVPNIKWISKQVHPQRLIWRPHHSSDSKNKEIS